MMCPCSYCREQERERSRSMTADVIRLPVQHVDRPHCDDCKRQLPHVFSLRAGLLEFPGFKLTQYTVRVVCVCGAVADLTTKLV